MPSEKTPLEDAIALGLPRETAARLLARLGPAGLEAFVSRLLVTVPAAPTLPILPPGPEKKTGQARQAG